MSMYQYLIPERLLRGSPKPIDTQMYKLLKREAAFGGYPPGKYFYSCRKLRNIYKTELRTIAAAVDLLVEDGLLEKRGARSLYDRIEEYFGCGECMVCRPVGAMLSSVLFQRSAGSSESEKYGLHVVVRIGRDKKEFLRWFSRIPARGL